MHPNLIAFDSLYAHTYTYRKSEQYTNTITFDSFHTYTYLYRNPARLPQHLHFVTHRYYVTHTHTGNLKISLCMIWLDGHIPSWSYSYMMGHGFLKPEEYPNIMQGYP